MTDINLNDFEEFLVADYAPLGKQFVLTIAGASIAQAYNQKKGQEEPVPVLAFRETDKKLKLTSRKNRKTLGRCLGAHSSSWIGQKIAIRVVEKMMFGQIGRIFEIVESPKVQDSKRADQEHADAKSNESREPADAKQPALLAK